MEGGNIAIPDNLSRINHKMQKVIVSGLAAHMPGNNTIADDITNALPA